ncbi:MAG: ABC transporter substrate-binding protein [Gammaproteobacteria bacterium]|jgi:phospholipid transport system substrate-binding protein|nr:ABC transporter substrate-binding protein [Gammaproteobacteria bacterium]
MKKFKKYGFLAAILPMMILGSVNSFADKKTPEDIILNAANNLFSDVEKNKKVYENDITAFYVRVDEILTPIIDFEILIKSIIGKKNYQETSAEQKNRFKIALKNQLIRIYAKTIVEYSKSKITIISSSETKGFYLVKTELSIGKGKPAFQVIYVMKKSSDKKWKIVEVVANGLRLVKSLRKSLLPEIQENGIESVINRLESES